MRTVRADDDASVLDALGGADACDLAVLPDEVLDGDVLAQLSAGRDRGRARSCKSPLAVGLGAYRYRRGLYWDQRLAGDSG